MPILFRTTQILDIMAAYN